MRETPQAVTELLRFQKSLIQLIQHNNSADQSTRVAAPTTTPQTREIEVLVRRLDRRG
jgi:hypothetical protein